MASAKLRPLQLNVNPQQDEKQQDKCGGDVKFKVMSNPQVIIIGISKYDKPNETLQGISTDIEKMKQLWCKKFHYENVQCIDSKYVTAKSLNSFLNDTASLIQLNKKVDGLILVYSGHGGIREHENYIICSDNKSLSVTKIQEKFSGEKLDHLAGRPKLLYLDCCRGEEKINDDEIIKQGKGGNDDNIYINKLSDFIIHYATCQNYKSWTLKNGGFLINAVHDCYSNNYKYHMMNGITLHDSSMIINESINKENKGEQTSEIIDRLTYDVYVQPYCQKPTDCSIKTRKEMVNYIDILSQQNKDITSESKQYEEIKYIEIALSNKDNIDKDEEERKNDENWIQIARLNKNQLIYEYDLNDINNKNNFNSLKIRIKSQNDLGPYYSQNTKIKQFKMNEIIKMTFNQNVYGKTLSFKNTTTVTKTTHHNPDWSTCLVDIPPITNKICNKFDIHIKLNGPRSTMVMGYVASKNDIKNWDYHLGAGDNKNTSFGIYFGKSDDYVQLYDKNNGGTTIKSECGSKTKPNDIFTFSFDFGSNEISIKLNNKIWIKSISLNNNKSIIPAISLDHKDDSAQIVKWTFY